MVPGSRTVVLGPDKVVYLLANARIATRHISVSVLHLCTHVDHNMTTGSGL